MIDWINHERDVKYYGAHALLTAEERTYVLDNIDNESVKREADEKITARQGFYDDLMGLGSVKNG